MSAILAIDAGTTGVTALVVDTSGRITGRGYRELRQFYPRPGEVEQDPEEILAAAHAASADAVASAGIEPGQFKALGITNQRETTVVWDRASGVPVHRAIVWQDRRTAARCDELRPREAAIRARTGLVLDPYFSATKLEWLLRHDAGLAARADRGEIAFGTVDSWLCNRLSGGRLHITDASNASRTLLYDIYRQRWDEELLETFGIPAAVLPEVVPSSGRLGDVEILGHTMPIAGIAGDQQAALFGQACFQAGMTKNTYGTGSFVLMNVGATPPPPPPGLLVTIAWRMGDTTTYALEGAIFMTGAALQWLRDGLGIISSAAEAGPLAESVRDTAGVYFVPALAGLGSPWWDPHARGAIVGLTGGATKAHIVRAAIDAMAHQTRDVVATMTKDANLAPAELRIDGGASVMDRMCQLQADLLGITVRRSAQAEATALGAAYLAGLGVGVWSSQEEVASLWREDRAFAPAADRGPAERLHEGWLKAVARTRS